MHAACCSNSSILSAAYLSGKAQSLLKGLLHKETPKWLGRGPNGRAAVKARPFFRSLNWKTLQERQASHLS